MKGVICYSELAWFCFLSNKPFPEERSDVKLCCKYRMFGMPRVFCWFMWVYTEMWKYGSLFLKWMFS